MNGRSKMVAIVSAVVVFFSVTVGVSGQQAGLSDTDRAVIDNAYRLWKAHGDELWPGWTAIAMPMIYIAGEHEYAIGFAEPPAGFVEQEWVFDGLPTYARDRQLNAQLAASFPFQGIPSVVIGTPDALESSSTRWSLTAVHEMFHVLQMQRGSIQKVTSLGIVDEPGDGSWQLNYPFPYDNADVMRLFHLLGYPLFLAVDQSASPEEVRYNIGTAIEAQAVLQSYLKQATGDDRAYDYARFQQWQEGIARYTEYRMAELAASSEFEPSAELMEPESFETYAAVWESHYLPQKFLFKHAGRVSRSRLEFYHLGLAMGLALDRSGIDWRDAYFAPDVWLDDLLSAAAE